MIVTAVVPVKNEPDLRPFLEMVGRYVDSVVVVDDTDPFDPSYLPGQGSLGASLHATLERVIRDRVVVIDAGWSHDPALIPSLLAHTEDVVIGSRFCPGGAHRGPWWRSTGSQVYGRLAGAMYGHPIRDWTSGFRVYSRLALDAISRMNRMSDGHAIQVELLLACLNAGCTWTEVPISYEVMPGSTLTTKAVGEAMRLLVR